MLTVRPILQNFPRHHLHVFVEGDALGLERGGNAVRDAQAKVLERDGHLNASAAVQIAGPVSPAALDIAFLTHRLNGQRSRVVAVVIDLGWRVAIGALDITAQIRQLSRLLRLGDGGNGAAADLIELRRCGHLSGRQGIRLFFCRSVDRRVYLQDAGGKDFHLVGGSTRNDVWPLRDGAFRDTKRSSGCALATKISNHVRFQHGV